MVLTIFTTLLVGEYVILKVEKKKFHQLSKNNKRGGPNKKRGGWNFSPKLISVAGRLLGTLEYIRNYKTINWRHLDCLKG